MGLYLLPTFDIVRSFEEFEGGFLFYDNGISGLVRDCVFLSTGLNRKNPTRYDHATSLIRKALRDFERSESYRQLILDPNQFRRSVVELEIEQVIDKLAESVDDMMHTLFGGRPYDVCKSYSRWVCGDLVAKIEILDDEEEWRNGEYQAYSNGRF